MCRTIEKYERCSYASLRASQSATETQASYEEYIKLKEQYEALQHSQRQLCGEDLGNLGLKELEQLERQLDSSLGKVQVLKSMNQLDKLSELQRKEEILLETNKILSRKLEEINKVSMSRAWEAGEQSITYNDQCTNSQGSLGPSHHNVTLHMGYNPGAAGHENVNGFIPSWML